VIRGLLLDVHGVLYTHPRAIPGSVEAVRSLARAEFPHLFLTNSTLHPKSWILASLRDAGFEIEPDRLMTAAEAAGDYLDREGFRRVGWLCQPDLREDLPGVDAVLPGAPEADRVDAVLVGDLGDGFTYAVLNRAFRWLLDGAALVAIARNRYYRGPEDRLVLDCGPFVSLLEDAAGVSARVIGKPSHAFFEAGLDRLGCPAGEAAMIGDDLHGDVIPAMEMGIQGIQVRTGKFREHDLREPKQPDDRVENLAEAVTRLLGDDASG